MSEAVKRYVIRHGCAEEDSHLLPGERAFVLAADHDRIVAELESQRAMWVANATELGNKCDQLAERCRELELELSIAKNDADLQRHLKMEARGKRDALRAEVKKLHVLLKEAGDELKELKASVGFRAHTLDVIQRIDAALEASR
ncbi:hypothetical protein [Azotobacter vinelandii]|uniref:hypothetical protein n=1 Tax=Azotobacter vinelandii TaxID=354 RepID=UPI0009109F44|nr:hypothetical protein [Azotobacter vinelandii]SFX57410.1 hypothetical protein SAMN04244547_02043 [Azotobacter vinelandii]